MALAKDALEVAGKPRNQRVDVFRDARAGTTEGKIRIALEARDEPGAHRNEHRSVGGRSALLQRAQDGFIEIAAQPALRPQQEEHGRSRRPCGQRCVERAEIGKGVGRRAERALVGAQETLDLLGFEEGKVSHRIEDAPDIGQGGKLALHVAPAGHGVSLSMAGTAPAHFSRGSSRRNGLSRTARLSLSRAAGTAEASMRSKRFSLNAINHAS